MPGIGKNGIAAGERGLNQKGRSKRGRAARRYNRINKPWRSARRFRAVVMGRSQVFMALCMVACIEAIFLTAQGVFAFNGMEKPLFGISRESSTWLLPEGGCGGKDVPDDKKERGVTIDIKNGKVEFWKKEQSTQRKVWEEAIEKEN